MTIKEKGQERKTCDRIGNNWICLVGPLKKDVALEKCDHGPNIASVVWVRTGNTQSHVACNILVSCQAFHWLITIHQGQPLRKQIAASDWRNQGARLIQGGLKAVATLAQMTYGISPQYGDAD